MRSLVSLFIFAIGCAREPAAAAARTAPAQTVAAPAEKAAAPNKPAVQERAKPSVEPPRPQAKFQDTTQAMAELVSAVLAQDAARLLACFSQKEKWGLTSTTDSKRRPTRYTYAQLQAGLKEEGDFRGVILGDTPDDNFRQEVERTETKFWRAKNTLTFIPPDGIDRDVYVKWRKEGDRFVVQEIGFPF